MNRLSVSTLTQGAIVGMESYAESIVNWQKDRRQCVSLTECLQMMEGANSAPLLVKVGSKRQSILWLQYHDFPRCCKSGSACITTNGALP